MSQQGDSFEEKTEQPTQKRIDDSRKEGRIARSRELTGAIVVLATGLALWLGGGNIVKAFHELLHTGLNPDLRVIRNPNALPVAFGEAALRMLLAITPPMLVSMVAAVASSALLGGFSFSMKAVAPKASRMNPVKGIGRLFSLRSVVELAKTLLKFVLVAGLASAFLWWQQERVLGLAREALPNALAEAATLSAIMFFILGGGLLLIGAIDAPYQLFEHNKQLRMTRQEIKEEFKQTEGRPEVKGRIRQVQQEMANKRSMLDVPTADVVVTNPTHFAVALRYQDGIDAAPVVVAKGADHLAAQIREIARASKVPLLEAPPLARALYRSTDIGSTIPRQLFEAVAHVLGWVYQLRDAKRHGTARPARPEIVVPRDAPGADPR